MADLPPYDRTFSFANYQANKPAQPVPGIQIDRELDDIASRLRLVGKSAYDLAVQNGFTGSIGDWLLSLVGPRGQTGQTGQPGADGTNGAAGLGAGVGPSELPTTLIPAPVQCFIVNSGATYKRGPGLRQTVDASGAVLSLDISGRSVRADWLGAVLDGVTDDGAAINAGLAAGLNVFLPPGTVAAVTSRLSLNVAGSSLTGFGTVKCLPGFNDDMIVGIGAAGCRVENVLLDGRAVTALSRWVMSGVSATASLATLDLVGVTVMGVPFIGLSIGDNAGNWVHGRVNVRGCTVIDAGWAGMRFDGVATLSLTDHTISATGYTALDFGANMGDISVRGGNVNRAPAPSTVYSGPGNPNVDTSTTSRAIVSSGSVTFTTTKDASTFIGFYPGKFITVHVGHGGPSGTQDKTKFMQGVVTSYSGTTLTLNIVASGGSGTYADWTLFGECGGLLGWLPPMGSLNVVQGKYSDCLQGGYDGFLLGEDGIGTTFGPTSIIGVHVEKTRGGGIDVTSNMKVIGCTIRDCLNPILFTLDLGGFIRDAAVIGNNLIDAGSTTGNNGSAIRFSRAYQGQNVAFVNIKITGNTVRGSTATVYAAAFDSLSTVGYQDVFVSGNTFSEVAGESFAWTGNPTPPFGITFENNIVKTPSGSLKGMSAAGDTLYPFGYKDYILYANSASNVKRIVDGAPGHNRIRVVANDSNTTLTPDWPDTVMGYGGDRLLMPGNNAVAIGGGSMIDFERQDPARGWYAEIKRPYA